MEDSFEEIRGSQYLRAMLNTLTDMIRVVTREGRIAYTNQSYDKRLAYRTDSVGRSCYELYGGDDICSDCIARDVMDTGRARQATRRINDRVYQMTAAPLTDEDGHNVGAIETFRDITLDVKIRDNLVSQTARLQADLQLAQKVQQSLVKSALPKVAGYDLFANYEPCEAVGGDMYDVFVSGDRLVMYVADASGHGVGPSMMGVFFSRAVHAANALGILSPPEILSYVQSEFRELEVDDALYITAFVVVLDISSGRYSYSNAGLSVVPVHYHAKRGDVEELYMCSPPISQWIENPEFGLGGGMLEPGDRLFLYSDGISELQTDEKTLGRMYEMFAAPDFTNDGFVRAVLRDLRGRPTDDLTMLLCVRQPS